MIYVCVGKFLHMASLGAVKEMEHFGSFGFLLPAGAQYYCSFQCRELAITKGVIQLPIAGHAYMINTLQWALRMD